MFCEQFLVYAVHFDCGAIILSINIHVGLNMHLYDDIGDASSSLWGSTSSFLEFVIGSHFTAYNREKVLNL